MLSWLFYFLIFQKYSFLQWCLYVVSFFLKMSAYWCHLTWILISWHCLQFVFFLNRFSASSQLLRNYTWDNIVLKLLLRVSDISDIYLGTWKRHSKQLLVKNVCYWCYCLICILISCIQFVFFLNRFWAIHQLLRNCTWDNIVLKLLLRVSDFSDIYLGT